MNILPLDQILEGDARQTLATLPADFADCIVTSSPYWALRDYGHEDQLGLEPTWREHLAALKPVFAECKRILKPTGNLFVNYGDTVATGAGGSKRAGGEVRPDPKKPKGAWQPANAPNRLASDDPKKHKLGLAWRLRFMLNDDLGFISRADIVWHKPNQMPLSVTDRVTTKYEMVFHLTKKPHYFFDLDAIRIPLAPSGGRGATREERRLFPPEDGKGPAPGQKPHSPQRPQAERALQLAEENNLSIAHLEAIKAVGISDAGKALVTNAGAGRNAEETQRLADEAKQALGGYFREFVGRQGDVLRNEVRKKTLNAPELGPARKNSQPPPQPSQEGAFHPLGANPGDVWTIPSQPIEEAHFATFPEELVRRLIACGSPGGGIVVDPFMGSGTTGLVAKRLGRRFIGCELNPDYIAIAKRRISPVMNQRLGDSE